MVTKIDVSDEDYVFLVDFMKKNDISEDSSAFRKILEEYRLLKLDENFEKKLPFIVAERSLCDAWNSDEDEEAFAYLQ